MKKKISKYIIYFLRFIIWKINTKVVIIEASRWFPKVQNEFKLLFIGSGIKKQNKNVIKSDTVFYLFHDRLQRWLLNLSMFYHFYHNILRWQSQQI